MLSKKILTEICKVGCGHDTCRYIVAGARGIECAKHTQEAKNIIDSRVNRGLFTATADNCEGVRHYERL